MITHPFTIHHSPFTMRYPLTVSYGKRKIVNVRKTVKGKRLIAPEGVA